MACERSGRVRDALIRRGHDAISCDIEPSDSPGPHICGRAETILDDGWDMVVAFPPCTYLTNAANLCLIGRCNHPNCSPVLRRLHSIEAAQFFRLCLDVAAPRVAVENPTPHPFARRLMGQPTAHTHPWWFGHPWTKRTLWWLRGLQPIVPTTPVRPTHRLVDTGDARTTNRLPILPISRVERSRVHAETPLGLAEAIAEQWGHPEPQTLL